MKKLRIIGYVLVILIFISLFTYADILENMRYYLVFDKMNSEYYDYSDSTQFWVADSGYVVLTGSFNPGTQTFVNGRDLEIIQASSRIHIQGRIDTVFANWANVDSFSYAKAETSTAFDAFIYSLSPESLNNFGACSTGYIGNDTLFTKSGTGFSDSAGIGRFLYKSANITDVIPSGAYIRSVVFKVYRNTHDTSMGWGRADLHEITKGWQEGDSCGNEGIVNWDSSIADISAWDSVGGSYLHSDTLDTASFSGTIDSLVFGSTDSLVNLVQNWVDGDSNYGVMVKVSVETTETYYPIITSDDTINLTLRPRWEIIYGLGKVSEGVIRWWIDAKDSSYGESWHQISDTLIMTDPGSLFVLDTASGYIEPDSIKNIPFAYRIMAKCDSDSVGIIRVRNDSWIDAAWKMLVKTTK